MTITRSVAFDNVSNLQYRMISQGMVVTEFYVDICCSWRKKLQEIFGTQLKVYLDLFCAVKRISSTISKKHPLYYECIKQLTLVFHDPTDQGEMRTRPTPSSEVMLQQLQSYEQKWKETEINGKSVLSKTFHNEISSLRKHIENGCLSGIKPSRGTNRNEALHKSLNKIMNASKYGVQLSYMLLTTFLYQHNERIAAKIEKRQCVLITEHINLHADIDVREAFGLIASMKSATVQSSDQKTIKKDPKVLSFEDSTFQDIVLRLTCNDEFPAVADNEVIDMLPNNNENEDNPETVEDISLIDVTNVLLRTIGWYTLFTLMSKYTKTASVYCTDMPFVSQNFGYSLSWPHFNDENPSVYIQSLNNVLSS